MKKSLLLLCVLVFSQFVFSQEKNEAEEEINEIIDNIISIDDEDLIDILSELKKYQILLTSVEFNNKTYFLGRDLGIDQFNVTTQIMYENSNGIFAGVSGSYYSELEPKWDLTVLTVGYGKSFGKKDNLRAELGYNRYIFSDSSSNDFSNGIDIGFQAATNNGALGTLLNASYLFGEKTGFQSSFSVYANFKLFNLSSKTGSKLSFSPDLSFFMGKENIDTSRIDNLGDFPFINNIVNEFETFSLRNIQLKLPLVLDFGNFNMEAGYNINFPQAFNFENNVDSTSFFNVELIYFIDLK